MPLPPDMIERVAVAIDPGAFDDSICSCPGCKLTQERSRDTAREQATRALTAALGDTYTFIDAKFWEAIRSRVIEVEERVEKLSPRGEQNIERQVMFTRSSHWNQIAAMIRCAAAGSMEI